MKRAILAIPILAVFAFTMALAADAKNEKATFAVGDSAKAKAAVGKLAGVVKAEAKGQLVSVEYSPAKVSPSKLALSMGSDARLLLHVDMH